MKVVAIDESAAMLIILMFSAWFEYPTWGVLFLPVVGIEGILDCKRSVGYDKFTFPRLN